MHSASQRRVAKPFSPPSKVRPSKWKKVALTPLRELASPEDFVVFSSEMRYSDEVVYALAEPLIIPKGRTLGGRLTKVCQFFSVIHVAAIAR